MGKESEEAGDDSQKPIGYEVDPSQRHVDANGWIQNLDVAKDVGWVSVIFSRAGSVRSNHWHRKDYHYLYVLSGCMVYEEWEPGLERDKEVTVFRAGQMVFTPPGAAHRTTFPVDTVLVSLSRLPRDHESHEKDVVRL